MIKAARAAWAYLLARMLRRTMRKLNPDFKPWDGFVPEWRPSWDFRAIFEALGQVVPIGTRTVLFGYHCFFIHPLFVFRAWWKLYGFPWDPRLWVLFVVHDLGYWGLPNLDGDEGETHPIWGARKMSKWFDRQTELVQFKLDTNERISEWDTHTRVAVHGYRLGYWGLQSLLHSRFLARKVGRDPSKFCIADKLAITLYPRWLFLALVRATGEIHEYMADAEATGEVALRASDDPLHQEAWYAEMTDYVASWVEANKGGGPDTMTPEHGRTTIGSVGVY